MFGHPRIRIRRRLFRARPHYQNTSKMTSVPVSADECRHYGFLSFSTSQRHSFFASCSFRISCLFTSHVSHEKECYLRYHSFSWLLFYICAGPFPFVWSLIVCFSSSLHTYIDRCSFSVPLQTGIRISSPRELTFGAVTRDLFSSATPFHH